jgi:hypothetical protein
MTKDEFLTQLRLYQGRVDTALLNIDVQLSDAVEASSSIRNLIEQYGQADPVPAPTAPWLARDMLWYTPDTPPRATDYATFVLQDSPTVKSQIAAVKPAATWRYASPVAKAPADPPGNIQCLPPSQIQSAWMQTGTRRDWAGNTQYFINPGNLAYISAVAAYLPGHVKDAGFDGVMIDEVNYDPRWTFANSTVTAAQHRADQLKFLAALRPALRDRGLKLMVNLGGMDPTWVSNVAATVDAIWIEQYVGRELSGYPPQVGDNWLQTQRTLLNLPVPFMVNVASASQSVIDYGFLSYLLIAREGDRFGSQPGGNGAPAYVTQTLWQQAVALGRPTASPTLFTTSGIRRFEHGTVSVSTDFQNGAIHLD